MPSIKIVRTTLDLDDDVLDRRLARGTGTPLASAV
jgi:hypothetical protein